MQVRVHPFDIFNEENFCVVGIYQELRCTICLVKVRMLGAKAVEGCLNPCVLFSSTVLIVMFV